jgi:hypothetical protein
MPYVQRTAGGWSGSASTSMVVVLLPEGDMRSCKLQINDGSGLTQIWSATAYPWRRQHPQADGAAPEPIGWDLSAAA